MIVINLMFINLSNIRKCLYAHELFRALLTMLLSPLEKNDMVNKKKVFSLSAIDVSAC